MVLWEVPRLKCWSSVHSARKDCREGIIAYVFRTTMEFKKKKLKIEMVIFAITFRRNENMKIAIKEKYLKKKF